ncbi:MAG: hypothetical protein GWN87_16645, partial [Desulfuromonadales bacterium]|nr:hypothetical protein [Desulfuromonadales bacterium]
MDDRFYFYDTDLTLHNIVENVDGVVLAGWRAAVTGSAYIGGRIAFKGEMGSDFSYGIDVNEVNVPNLPDMEVCVYADGRPLGVYDVTADPNGSYTVDLEDEYDVVILGLNYYSILETMPLHKQTLLGRQGHIQDVTIDFHESMGTHVGASMDYSADWLFSDDDFATAMAPYSGYKGPAPFLRGTSRDPEVYLYEWDPIPMTIRSI